jgi:transposase
VLADASPAGGREGAVIKLGEIVMILELHRQGVSVSAIARQLGIDRKTVRKHIAAGLTAPSYKARPPRERVIASFEPYLRERLAAYPALTGRRLWREIKERGYAGGYTAVTDMLRELRPPRTSGFEVRFETPPGAQAQVDFARFDVEFLDEPGVKRIVWLFSMVLGHSRFIWARFVLHQDMQSVLRCHMAAFEALGGVPREILYLPVTPGGGNLFFQLVNARYEKGAMILTSNRGFAEWGEIFGDPVVATALLDRLLHHAVVFQIEGSSYRLREHADLLPEHVRTKASIQPAPIPPTLRRRGRPPKNGGADQDIG